MMNVFFKSIKAKISRIKTDHLGGSLITGNLPSNIIFCGIYLLSLVTACFIYGYIIKNRSNRENDLNFAVLTCYFSRTGLDAIQDVRINNRDMATGESFLRYKLAESSREIAREIKSNPRRNDNENLAYNLACALRFLNEDGSSISLVPKEQKFEAKTKILLKEALDIWCAEYPSEKNNIQRLLKIRL